MNDLLKGMIIGFCAGLIIVGLTAGFVIHRTSEKEKLLYAEKQMELQVLREDINSRPLTEFLIDPAVRGAVYGAAGDFERQRDELLQRFRGRITD